MRGQQRGNLAILGGDGAERGAAGQNGVLKVEAVDEPLACLFVVALRNGEHVAHHDQLFVVDLEDVRIAEQFFDEFVGVEVRTQVDVEELQSAFLGVLEQFDDGVVGFGGAQTQGAEADGVGLGHGFDELVGELDVVPSHVFDDGVFRNAVGQGHVNRAGRVFVGLHQRVDAGLVSVGEQFGTQLVVADGSDGEAFRAVLGRMVCEIDGCAAGTLAGGEHIPQDFAERNDDWLGHGVPFFGCGVLCDVKEHRRMFQKIGDGHGRGTADGGVRWEVGQGDFGIVPDFGDGTFPNDFFDLVKQGLSGLGDDVAEYDMRRIEGVDDIDRAISDISSDLGSQIHGRFVSCRSFGEQRGACLRVRHCLASGHNARLFVEPFVDCVG